MTNTLYCFLTDDAFIQNNILNLTMDSEQNFGALIGEGANYFASKGIMGDSRKSRLAIINNKRPQGSMSVKFDQSRIDIEMLKQMTDIDNALLFNIIERIVFKQEFTDENIEYQLVNNSTYRGYIAGSYTHSTEENTVTLYDEERLWKTTVVNPWFAFDFKTDNVEMKVHIWLSLSDFVKNYPYTTITNVIAPYDPKLLVDPVSFIQVGNLQVLTDGSSFIFDKVNLETLVRDQNGVYRYATKYVLDNTRVLSLPFAISYCGAKVPTSLECRKAIREYLETNTTATSAQLEQLFPELYINSRFFIVPLWDMKQTFTDREVYTSVQNISAILNKAKMIFSDYDAEFRDTYLELLLNSQNKMWSITLPDQLNDQIFSILEQHPTYVDYSSQVPGFKYMTAETKDFAGKLASCMAVLNGETLTTDFIKTEVDGFEYLTFNSGKAEYCVMTKDSYNKFFENI